MNILVLGAAGMIGRKLINKLISDNTLLTSNDTLYLHDVVPPQQPSAHPRTILLDGDISDPAQATKLAEIKADVIFHLASIVSGEAEMDFDKGWSINMRGGWNLLEALRAQHHASDGRYRPKVIFASSIAVFGPPFPDAIEDDFLAAPQTSYGAQKACVEMLVSDYARKGFIEGLSIRFPTICVRPGKPNLAASGFFSGIIREPLNGQEAILPVSSSVRHWHASPRSAAAFLVQAAELGEADLKGRRSLNMPGVSCTVEEQIEALRHIAGEDAVKLIKPVANPDIIKIVDGWPRNFNPQRALELGFTAEKDFTEIIKVYMEDDLPNA